MPELVHMDEDTLTHYGVLGMKWGQHIFESRSIKAAKRLRKYTEKASKVADKRDKVVARNKANTYMLANSVLRDHEVNKGKKSELTKMLESNVKSGKKEASKLQKKGLRYVEKANKSAKKLQDLKRNQQTGKDYVDSLIVYKKGG